MDDNVLLPFWALLFEQRTSSGCVLQVTLLVYHETAMFDLGLWLVWDVEMTSYRVVIVGGGGGPQAYFDSRHWREFCLESCAPHLIHVCVWSQCLSARLFHVPQLQQQQALQLAEVHQQQYPLPEKCWGGVGTAAVAVAVAENFVQVKKAWLLL